MKRCTPIFLLAIVACSNDSNHAPTDVDRPGEPDAGFSEAGVQVNRGPDYVEIDADEYRGPCSDDSDCAVIADVFECGCGRQCPDEIVLADRADDARADLAAAAEQCTVELAGECDVCVDFQPPTLVCENQECIEIPPGSCRLINCDAFAEARDIEWTFTPRCVEDTCTECPCPDGYECDTIVCRPLDPCDQPRDCSSSDEVRGYLGCVDGYCQNCEDDTHCRDNFYCNNGSCDLR